MTSKKITSFTDLRVWKEAHCLVIHIYKDSRNWPKDEIYGLTNQIRRASVSVTSNIAEGFSRRSSKEKIHFYYLPRGSLTEVQNQLLIARDVEYLKPKVFNNLASKSIECSKMLQGLISSVKKYHS